MKTQDWSIPSFNASVSHKSELTNIWAGTKKKEIIDFSKWEVPVFHSRWQHHPILLFLAHVGPSHSDTLVVFIFIMSCRWSLRIRHTASLPPQPWKPCYHICFSSLPPSGLISHQEESEKHVLAVFAFVHSSCTLSQQLNYLFSS